MKRDFNTPPAPVARNSLLEACDAIEEWARHVFGGPSVDQAAFEAAWQIDEPDGYSTWVRLKAEAQGAAFSAAEVLLAEALFAYENQAPKWNPPGYFSRVRAHLYPEAPVSLDDAAADHGRDPESLEQGDAL